MVEPVKYTTQFEGSSRTRARADVGDDVLLVVPTATVLGASPERRQRLSVASGLPWPLAEALARDGAELIVARARNEGDAQRQATLLAGQLGVTPLMRTAGAGARTGLAIAAGGLGMLLLLLGVVLWLVWPSVEVVLWMASLASFFGAWRLANGGAGERAAFDAALTADARARARMADAAAAWAALFDVRRRSLDADVPVQAQVDLWTVVDTLEGALLRGEIAPDEAAVRLQEGAHALGANPEAASAEDALQRLRQVVAATAVARRL